jgi:hypothetical protein
MIIIPCVLESYRSLKDRSVKLIFETGELSPSQIGDVAANLQHSGFLAFNGQPFQSNEKELIESLKADFEETGKTPGQRLRGVLYRCWEHDKAGYETFTDYYNSVMEKMIVHHKSKLP